jgi:hypothetical protein
MCRRESQGKSARATWLGTPSLLLAASLAAQSGCASESMLRVDSPEGAVLAPAASSLPSADPHDDEPKSDPTTARTIGWVSIAVGSEAAIVAGVTSGLMLNDKSTRDSNCNAQKVCSTIGFNANNQLGALAGWNAAAWVTAAAGLGLGTVLILTHPLTRHSEVYVSPAGVALGGQF